MRSNRYNKCSLTVKAQSLYHEAGQWFSYQALTDVAGAEAATRDQDGAFPVTAFKGLRQLGLVANPPLQTAQAPQLFRVLAAVGRGDLSVGRLPSDVQKSTFELLGAIPMRMDLTEAIEMIKAGTIDAQGNPFANSVTYGVHKFHHFHTVTNHFYVSRPIFVHRQTFDAWPEDLREAMRKAATGAVAMQREFAIEEDKAARQAILGQGCEILDLSEDEHATFAAAVNGSLWRAARPMDRRCSTCRLRAEPGTISCARPHATSSLRAKVITGAGLTRQSPEHPYARNSSIVGFAQRESRASEVTTIASA